MVRPYFIINYDIPSELNIKTQSDKKAYWDLVASLVQTRKDDELKKGLNYQGEPLGRPSALWLRRRRSKMLPPQVKGDPSSPLFQPGRDLSRVRSLFATRPLPNGGVQGYWRYDAKSHQSFGLILAYWAERKGPTWNVIGLSPNGVKWVQAQASQRWRTKQLPQKGRSGTPLTVPKAGSQRSKTVTLAVGHRGEIEAATKAGRFSGWMTEKESAEFWSQARKTGTLTNPSRTPPKIISGSTNNSLKYLLELKNQTPVLKDKNVAVKLFDKLRGIFGF